MQLGEVGDDRRQAEAAEVTDLVGDDPEGGAG